MGLIPKVNAPLPAFVHVDVDDLWAIGECYGIKAPEEWAHHVSKDALPRFEELFHAAGIQATFFLVGRDLENSQYAENIKKLISRGHCAANHSWSHSLRFRDLSPSEMAEEVDKAHHVIGQIAGVKPIGFRAPGYGWSQQLIDLLDERGYAYDASLMPSPYGGIFRWLDSRMQQDKGKTNSSKTQYPLLSDTWNSLYPTPAGPGGLIEVPSATSPLLRLPFQAGVCMRLGYPYFRACFEPYRINKALPFVFLFHAADLADFSQVPIDLFRQSRFFNKPVSERMELARRFLQTISSERPVVTTEQWLA